MSSRLTSLAKSPAVRYPLPLLKKDFMPLAPFWLTKPYGQAALFGEQEPCATTAWVVKLWEFFPLNRSIPKLIKRLISPETTKADIRAVRGPLTREAILKEGGKCPEIYGDPAIIMPRLYTPKIGAKHKAGLILHHTQETPTTHVLAKGSSSKALSNFAPRELLSITQAKFLCKRLFRVLLKSFLRLADSTKFRLTELEMSS